MRLDMSEQVDARYTNENVLGEGGLAYPRSIAPAVTAFHVSDAPHEIASHRACSSSVRELPLRAAGSSRATSRRRGA